MNPFAPVFSRCNAGERAVSANAAVAGKHAQLDRRCTAGTGGKFEREKEKALWRLAHSHFMDEQVRNT
jgi:hypothetical protein